MDIYSEMLADDASTLPASDAPPLRYLIICTTPRTSGHYVCNLFSRQGWGRPAEYFNPRFMIEFVKRRIDETASGIADLARHRDQYRAEIYRRSVRNSIFSTKLFPTQFEFYQASILPNLPQHYVHLRRRDKRAQVVSVLTALVTKRVFDREDVYESLPSIARDAINLEVVQKVFNQLLAGETWWRTFLFTCDTRRWMNMSTEEFVDNPEKCINDISNKFDLELSLTPSSGHQLSGPYKQDRELKNELAQQFKPLLDRLQNEYDRRYRL